MTATRASLNADKHTVLSLLFLMKHVAHVSVDPWFLLESDAKHDGKNETDDAFNFEAHDVSPVVTYKVPRKIFRPPMKLAVEIRTALELRGPARG